MSSFPPACPARRVRPWVAGFTLGCLLAAWAPDVQARPAAVPYGFDFQVDIWDTQEGLPDYTVSGVAQTQDGTIWLGTFRGLVRWTGQEMRVLTPRTTPEMPSPSVVSMHLDRDGRLWVSTTSGLMRLDGDRWTRLDATRGWTADYVRSYAEGAGAMHFTSFNGKVFSFADDRFQEMPEPPGNRGNGYFAATDVDGRLWLGQPGQTAGRGYLGFWNGSGWEPAPDLDVVASTILGLGQARDGGIWLVFQKEIKKVRDGKVVESRKLTRPAGVFWRLLETMEGELWLGGVYDGAYRIATNGEVHAYGTSHWLRMKTVRGLWQDREGELWLGTTPSGLVRFKKARFKFLAESLPETQIAAVAPWPQGGVAIGTYGRGIVLFDGNEIKPPPWETRLLGDLPFLHTLSLMTDRAGRLWMGMEHSGVQRFRDGKLESVGGPALRDATGPNVSTLYEDHQGHVWIAGDKGLVEWNDREFTPRLLPHTSEGARPRVYFTERQGGSLIAGCAQRIYTFSPASGTFEPLATLPEMLRIASLYADPEGHLCVGVRGEGVFGWWNGRWHQVGRAQGLAVEDVCNWLEGPDGHLWLQATRSIVRVRPQHLIEAAEGRVQRVEHQFFDGNDGLRSSDSRPGLLASIACREGERLWFPTFRGVAMIEPSTLRLNLRPPQLQITKLWVEQPGNAGSIRTLNYAPPFPNELVVPPGTRRLGIDLQAHELFASSKVRCAVRLLGRNPAWLDLGSQRTATFDNLSPGTYHLEILATGSDGARSRIPITHALRVQPFLHQTPWFRILATLGLLGTIGSSAYGLARWRLKQRLEVAQRDRELAAAQSRLAAVLETTSDLVWFTRLNGEVFYVNRTAAARLTRDPNRNQPPLQLSALFTPETWRRIEPDLRGVIEGGPPWEGEADLQFGDGSKLPVSVIAARHGAADPGDPFLSLIARDLTDRERHEHELRQMQKMETVGRLAGGIAHDFNNILQAMTGFTDLAREANNPAEREACLSEVTAAGSRATQLTRQLLAFGRRQPLRREDTDLAELTSQMIRMLRRLLGERVQISFVAAPGLGNVLCDRALIEQVILNFCVNARDAMPEGGSITIQIENATLTDAFARREAWARPGSFVLLSVTDNGVGMDEATQEQIFEPFFTTKPKDKGTGLGLAVVYGNIRQHDGLIHVRSEPGRGSTFTIYLPVSPRTEVVTDHAPPPELREGSGTILIAEDEPSLQRLNERILLQAGYRVLIAGDGEEAVRLFHLHTDEIVLACFDVVMPRQNGPEACADFRRVRPDLPVIFCSGYSEEATGCPVVTDTRTVFLRKPCQADTLLRAIRQLLQAPQP